jgi:PDZ domain-containing secreted protein
VDGLSLKDNDVITHIDGQGATNPAKSIEAIGSKKAKKITVQIDRKSVPVSEEQPGGQPTKQ